MQKVEGSSPFSRFEKAPQMRGFSLMDTIGGQTLSQDFVPKLDRPFLPWRRPGRCKRPVRS
jgi:hypothetical protein